MKKSEIAIIKKELKMSKDWPDGFYLKPKGKKILKALVDKNLGASGIAEVLGKSIDFVRHIYSYARIKIPRQAVGGNHNKPDIKDQIFDFLRGKTIKEIIAKFNLSEKAVDKFLAEPPQGFKIYRDISPQGDRLFCLPTEQKNVIVKPKIWAYLGEVNNGPAVDVFIPDDIGWEGQKNNKEKLGQKGGGEKIRLVPLSDIWFNHELHDSLGFNERIDWIARNPHVFCFLNGDAIYPSFKTTEEGYDKFCEVLDSFTAKLSLIAHKILWAQGGCFEDRLEKTHFDPVKSICQAWDIPYFTSALSAGIHWAGNLFTFYCVHGRSQAQKKGTKLNAVLRVVGEIEFFNYIVMSHIRDTISSKYTRVREDRVNFDLAELKQFAFICPSFVKYDGSRESKWGYQLPFRGQVNCTLYKSGDYHFYSSSPTANLTLHNGNGEETKNGK